MSNIGESAYYDGILNRVMAGKFAGAELKWLSDHDLVDVREASNNFGFKAACAGLLCARQSSRQRRIARGRHTPQ